MTPGIAGTAKNIRGLILLVHWDSTCAVISTGPAGPTVPREPGTKIPKIPRPHILRPGIEPYFYAFNCYPFRQVKSIPPILLDLSMFGVSRPIVLRRDRIIERLLFLIIEGTRGLRRILPAGVKAND